MTIVGFCSPCVLPRLCCGAGFVLAAPCEPLWEAMPQTEAARWKAISIGGTCWLGARVPTAMRVRGQRCDERMEDIAQERHRRRGARMLVGKFDLEPQDCVGIRTLGITGQQCVGTFLIIPAGVPFRTNSTPVHRSGSSGTGAT